MAERPVVDDQKVRVFGEPVPEREEFCRQAPETEKHPAVRLMPCANVEVAEPVELNWFAAMPPVNVEVEVVPPFTLKYPWNVDVPVVAP